MAPATNLIYLSMKIISFLILFQSTNQASTSDYFNLLSRLYKKASDANRPLILIFDKETPRPNPTHSNLIDIIDKEIGLVNKKVKSLNSLKHKKKIIPKRLQHRSQNLDNTLENQLLALLPSQKKRITKEQGILRSPVIKSLLRISNDLKCEAKDECQDECSEKYSNNGHKQNNCNIQCEVKFDCEEEESGNSCEEDECQDSNDCEGGSCTGSTKGWAVTDPVDQRCPEC